MVSSRVIGGTTSSSSNALKHVIEIVFGWTPVNLGYMYFNEQGYNRIGDLLTMDSTEIDEMRECKECYKECLNEGEETDPKCSVLLQMEGITACKWKYDP